TFALSSASFARAEDLAAARSLARYLLDFLRGPRGTFGVSQDADLPDGTPGAVFYALGDEERRRLGMPAIDRHVYPRENGWAIAALTELAEATGDLEALGAATTAATALRAAALKGGAFGHGTPVPSLGDTVSMGQAFLTLYRATGELAWLEAARSAAGALDGFADPRGAGYDSVAAAGGDGVFAIPVRDADENVAVARFTNLLARLDPERPAPRVQAERALRFVAAEGIAATDTPPAGLLLAERELREPPVHIAVVGVRDDPRTRELFAAALKTPSRYKRVERLDPGQLPTDDGAPAYPVLPRPAAYACGPRSCSAPAFSAEALRQAVLALGSP
ncbi:MAG TPA: hypothetical protein VGD56_12705, partial [Gemmatirosa sp.]